MPTRRPIGQVVFDHQTHCPLLHTMGVMALGQSQVVHVGIEASMTGRALMLGIGQVDVYRPVTPSIAQIVQDPPSYTITPGSPLAEGATSSPVIPAPPLDPRWRKILHPCNTFCPVRNVLAWPFHDRFSRRSASGEIIG